MSKHIYYEPIFLQGKGDDHRCTLLVRIFDKHLARSGNSVTSVKFDALTYEDEKEMADAIHENNMLELPKEAEGNQKYVPSSLRSKTLRRVY